MMFLINYIPEWTVHLGFLLGLGLIFTSFVLYFVPFVATYRLPILLVGIIIACAGSFIEGVYYSNNWWLTKVREMELKVAEAEAKAAQVNVQIVTKYVEKIKVVKEKTNENIKYIETYITKHDNSIVFPKSFIMLHDSASQNEVSGSTGSPDESPSDVKASELLSTVVENYGTCYELRETVVAWQDWYKAQKEVFENTFK
jgi:hypothetical protein